MSNFGTTNDLGQGKSHATGESKVPGVVQDKAPKGLEESLPESVHPTSVTGSSGSKSDSTSRSHAVHAADGSTDSVVPQKLQKKLPEGVEKAVPNALHNTGSK